MVERRSNIKIISIRKIKEKIECYNREKITGRRSDRLKQTRKNTIIIDYRTKKKSTRDKLKGAQIKHVIRNLTQQMIMTKARKLTKKLGTGLPCL
jgi:hypothetical protein